jgi:hypothetical protein
MSLNPGRTHAGSAVPRMHWDRAPIRTIRMLSASSPRVKPLAAANPRVRRRYSSAHSLLSSRPSVASIASESSRMKRDTVLLSFASISLKTKKSASHEPGHKFGVPGGAPRAETETSGTFCGCRTRPRRVISLDRLNLAAPKHTVRRRVLLDNENDDPARIGVLSEHREPRDLSETGLISNRQ